MAENNVLTIRFEDEGGGGVLGEDVVRKQTGKQASVTSLNHESFHAKRAFFALDANDGTRRDHA